MCFIIWLRDLIDVLVRLAADLIERSRADEQLRESEERLRFRPGYSKHRDL
jgi:hypothetical protein